MIIQYTSAYLVSEFQDFSFDTIRVVLVVIDIMVEMPIGLKFIYWYCSSVLNDLLSNRMLLD